MTFGVHGRNIRIVLGSAVEFIGCSRSGKDIYLWQLIRQHRRINDWQLQFPIMNKGQGIVPGWVRNEVFCLPVHSFMSNGEVERVVVGVGDSKLELIGGAFRSRKIWSRLC